ncbi:SRPBCC family protein [Antarcticibacterium sp. 1MA-6-2]|uniref:SRPBCC family protein n=1 Tax=Antarcticibacterium sp. 1MA-6-2 TaxID=2908210 RepID=UPI001F190BEB|nr:SRPBCC family protein [Antarcticibacterium sp. 1MA-6-2]UJH92784.1 SRPBCC family protein [Antarcticibacterium sp. 1MA-6-2]
MESQNEKKTNGSTTSTTRTGSGATKRSYSGKNSGGQGDILSTLKENKKGLLGVLGAVVGGALLYKGAKGMKGSGKSSSKSIVATSKLTINKSREELYAYWRNLENLPNFMSHIKEIKETGDKRSEWVAKIPGGIGTIEWDAEIIQERTNHLLMWRSLPGSEIDNSGEVRFEIDPKGKGTIVETTITYRPPAGDAGGFAAKLLNPAFEKLVKNDLKQFKKLMEKGGKAKRISQPSSRV